MLYKSTICESEHDEEADEEVENCESENNMEILVTVNNEDGGDGGVEGIGGGKGHEQEKGGNKSLEGGEVDRMEGIMEEGITVLVDDTTKGRREDDLFHFEFLFIFWKEI